MASALQACTQTLPTKESRRSCGTSQTRPRYAPLLVPMTYDDTPRTPLVFGTPSKQGRRTHDQWVAEEAQRLAWKREQAARRLAKATDGRSKHEDYVAADKPERPKTCTEPGCDRPHKARGLCATHYKRWRRGTGKDN